jgi:ABC-type nitrate/sulfonate/bicarbonate transport system substrate-binding protein
MVDYEPVEIKGFYRSHSHLPLWEVLEKAGIWREVGIRAAFEYCGSSAEAEDALFSGRIDFISGNHITPYALVASGRPIVSLASPSNSVSDKLVSREPFESVAELRGKRIADTTILDQQGGYNHIRGNRMLYLMDAGVDWSEVVWVEVADAMSEAFLQIQFETMQSGGADAAFVTGDAADYKAAGFHVLALDRLPMISGPTLTTTLGTLKRKDRLGERLVKAMLMGIRYARAHRGETEHIIEGLKKRVPEARTVSYNSLAKLPLKPYPEPRAVMNAHRLCCMKAPVARDVSSLALWDLHYLRELDASGFIDDLQTPNK